MIVRHLVTVILIYASLVVQSSLGSDIAFHGFRPWLPGIALAACVVLHDGAAGILWSGLLGLGIDCLSGERLGVNVVAATFVATGLLLFRHDNRPSGTTAVSAYVFAGTSFWRIMSATTLSLLANRRFDGSQILVSAFGDGVYTFMLSGVGLLCIHLLKSAVWPTQASSSISLTNRWSMLTR